MQRRRLLAGLVAGLPLPFVGRSSQAEPEPEPGPIDPKPMIFDRGGQYLRVCPVERTLEVADRREILGHLPQPEPIERIDIGGTLGAYVLVWDHDPSGTCTRCRWGCNASRSQRGDWRCGVRGRA